MSKERNLLARIIGLLALGVIMAGCATRMGDFTLMTSRNVDLSRMGQFQRSKNDVKGTDSIVTILGFIPVKSHMDLKKALDNALSKIPGAVAIVDVRLDLRRMNFILFQLQSYVISGTALIDPNVASITDDAHGQYLVLNTEDGENFTLRYITEDEYNSLLVKN